MESKRGTSKTRRAAPATAARPVAKTLTKAELGKYRRLLLAKRQSLVGDLDGMTAEARGATSPSDLPDENLGTETTIGLLAHERTLLGEIHEALERIGNGTYGTCLATGRPIGKARLEARPWAKYCIEYARATEGRRGLSQSPSASWRHLVPQQTGRAHYPEDDDLDALADFKDLHLGDFSDTPPDF